MFVEIRKKFCPFTHKIGEFFNLLGSTWKVQVFPCRLYFQNNEKCSSSTSFFELLFEPVGEWKNFTVIQNLEKGYLRVFGTTDKGYICYRITVIKSGFLLFLERGTELTYCLRSSKKEILGKLCKQKELLLEEELSPYKEFKEIKERLFLGINKQQDFELMAKRGDLREILPLWHLLSQHIPYLPFTMKKTTVKTVWALLDACCCENSEKSQKAFLELFKIGMSATFVPKIFDDLWQGIVKGNENEIDSPIPLLVEAGHCIKKLFFEVSENNFSILKNLPPLFASGRFIHIDCPLGEFSFEWSKKLLRIMEFKALKSFEMHLELHSKIENFRVRKNGEKKGVIIKRGSPIFIENGADYLFDRFQK